MTTSAATLDQQIRDANVVYKLIADYMDSTPYSPQAVATVRRLEQKIGELAESERRIYNLRRGL